MMKVISTEKIKGFIAGDKTRIKELLHPEKNNVEINYSLAHATVAPGEASVPHILSYSEAYYILAGTGNMHVDEEEKVVKKGDLVYIPPKANQWIENIGTTDLTFICIVSPPWNPDCEIIL